MATIGPFIRDKANPFTGTARIGGVAAMASRNKEVVDWMKGTVKGFNCIILDFAQMNGRRLLEPTRGAMFRGQMTEVSGVGGYDPMDIVRHNLGH
jgi:hypothetical protein